MEKLYHRPRCEESTEFVSLRLISWNADLKDFQDVRRYPVNLDNPLNLRSIFFYPGGVRL